MNDIEEILLSSALFSYLVDEKFIEDRRRSLKHFLEIISRHPILCETEIVKFFLTYQGTVRISSHSLLHDQISIHLVMWR